MTKYSYISVDIETAGPNPSSYSLLTIGACTLDSPPQSFYIELKPVNTKMTPEAQGIHHLDIKRLNERGTAPAEAMERFESWVRQVTPEGEVPLFLAFNAPFDWMFIAFYFHRYLGSNPFGHKALDMKAFFMGMHGTQWKATGFDEISEHYQIKETLKHNALEDAIAQANLFRRMLEERSRFVQPQRL